jgi:hypothetical protein
MSYSDDNRAHRKGLHGLTNLRRDPRWHVVFARSGILVLHRSHYSRVAEPGRG